MRKIPTLFMRNMGAETDRLAPLGYALGLVRDEATLGCEWVLAGEGIATLKVDGTCCLIKGGCLYKRYELKSRGQSAMQMYSRAPEGFEPAQDPDPVTGDIPGWVPVRDGPEDKYHVEAFNDLLEQTILANIDSLDGTYELIGPRIQGNPYGLIKRILYRHGARLTPQPPSDFEGLEFYLRRNAIEGIVWHHPDGRMAKIKRRDFGLEWPLGQNWPIPTARLPEQDL